MAVAETSQYAGVGADAYFKYERKFPLHIAEICINDTRPSYASFETVAIR